MTHVRPIRVFIATPGDLAVERKAFREVVEALNGGFGDGAGVEFVALGWEDKLAATGRRSQAVINADIDSSDVFVLALYARWGQAAPDAEPYTSYTEEEFHRALDRWTLTRSPEIFVFFKQVTPREMGDPGEQLKKVLDFRRSLEKSRVVLYRGFVDENDFRTEVDRHLRAYAKGEVPRADAPREAVVLPLAYIEQVEQAKEDARREAERADREHRKAEAANARAEVLALDLAERAAQAALQGLVEEAAQTFAKAQQGTTNLKVLALSSEFYQRTGALVTAEELLERWLAISGRDSETAETAEALRRVGVLSYIRGDLDRAETMLDRALSIAKRIPNKESEGRAYGTLGLVYKTRGDLDRAEEIFQKALGIAEQLEDEGGKGRAYGNLGLVYRTRGELDRAEEMHHKALAIAIERHNDESIATQFGNLGLVYQMRADAECADGMHQRLLATAIDERPYLLGVVATQHLDRAEEMHQKALAINLKLARQEGIAAQYCNLGLIYQMRGDLNRAEDMLNRALGIHETLGRQEGLADQYCNLGLIYQLRGQSSAAEEMHLKALAIDVRLGRQERIAGHCGNLGLLYQRRGERERALESYSKARDLWVKIKVPRMVEQVEKLLDGVTNTDEITRSR